MEFQRNRMKETIKICDSEMNKADMTEEDILDAAIPNLRLLFDETKKKVDQAKKRLQYFTYHELPKHLQDNYYIHSGYRAYYSVSECFESVFAVHNETGNIWTHFLGALFFAGCLYFGISGLPSNADVVDYIMLSVFLISAIKCLVFSALYHTLCAHAQRRVFDSCMILDYSGISFLIFGSFMIVVNYGLYCYSLLRWLYISLVGAFCAMGIILPWFAFFRSNSFVVGRTVFYVSLGLVSGLVFFHTIYLNGLTFMANMVPFEYLLLEVFLYLFGAYIYAVRIPESWFPGKYDHWFHSHQFWHVMVLGAAYCHYQAVIELMHSRLTRNTCII